jgi:hypothetical protein
MSTGFDLRPYRAEDEDAAIELWRPVLPNELDTVIVVTGLRCKVR